MNVQITVRHSEVTDEVKARTEALVQKLKKFDTRMSMAEVVFDEEGHDRSVEGILHIDGDSAVVAKAQASDALSAVDQMIEKLAKILRRRRSQVTHHRGAPKEIHEPDLALE